MQAYWLSLLYEEELGLHKENLCGFLKTNRLSTNNAEKMFVTVNLPRPLYISYRLGRWWFLVLLVFSGFRDLVQRHLSESVL